MAERELNSGGGVYGGGGREGALVWDNYSALRAATSESEGEGWRESTLVRERVAPLFVMTPNIKRVQKYFYCVGYIPVAISRDVKHRAAACAFWDSVPKQRLLRHQHALRSNATNKLMRGYDDGVFVRAGQCFGVHVNRAVWS